jgi:hypothetical protein
MWSGRRGLFTFGLGMRPFGFYFFGPGGFPRRERYLRMLEEYRDSLREELAAVEKEIQEISTGRAEPERGTGSAANAERS